MLSTTNNNEFVRLGLLGLLALGLVACGQDAEPEATASPAASAPAPAPAPVFDRDPVPPSPTAAEDLLGRGKYLVEGIVGCGNCHDGRDENGELIPGRELSGNFVIEERMFTAYAPNITPDMETGIGAWTDEEIERAIRSGISRDGRQLGPPMAFYPPFYPNISSEDMDAIIAYLRSAPPIRNEVPPYELRMELPPSWGPPVEEPVVAPPRTDQVAYGEYLAQIGHCTQCHTPLVNGVEDFTRIGAGMNIYPTPFGYDWSAISANITSHETLGIGAWTDDEIKRAIVDGISRDGRELLPFMGFSYYELISDEDLDAIVAYLRTLPPAVATPPTPEAE
jgi:mono/diheme cytochrome c family protein